MNSYRSPPHWTPPGTVNYICRHISMHCTAIAAVATHSPTTDRIEKIRSSTVHHVYAIGYRLQSEVAPQRSQPFV
eukprot:COSAG01_NODE_54680_length_330_cov_1.090909_1_plen_74_part_10